MVHRSKNIRTSLLVWSRTNHKTRLSWKIEWNPRDDQRMEFEGLSSFGKVTVIKTFLVPKLLYVSIILETLEETMKQMERWYLTFCSKDQIKRQDSLLLTRFRTVAWILRILKPKLKPWGCPGFHRLLMSALVHGNRILHFIWKKRRDLALEM